MSSSSDDTSLSSSSDDTIMIAQSMDYIDYSDGWIAAQDEKGATYYYNTVTVKSQWEVPEGFVGVYGGYDAGASQDQMYSPCVATNLIELPLPEETSFKCLEQTLYYAWVRQELSLALPIINEKCLKNLLCSIDELINSAIDKSGEEMHTPEALDMLAHFLVEQGYW